MKTTERGFTLIEMIVAVGLFAVVMLISVAALLSLSAANRKAQALQSVVNNLNISIDGMVRSIREGSDYKCGGSVDDCTDGRNSFSYESLNDGNIRIEFDGNSLLRNRVPMTAPEVHIESATFYVVGARRGNADTEQPKVMIVLKGTAGASANSAQSTFHIQATAVQRVLDI